jgi:hypothetical protein
MLCDKCQEREANHHLSSTVKLSAVTGHSSEDGAFEHHFCEACALLSPLTNPALKFGPDFVKEQLRVVSVSAEWMRVRLIRTEKDPVPEEWTFLTCMVPEGNRIVGKEFGITCSRKELEQLRGKP